MGGEISKVKGKNNRIPPNFLRRRLHDKRKRRRFRRPTKQSTPSKKELLSYAIEDDENLEGSLGKSEYVIKDIKKVEANDDDQERVAKLIQAIVQENDDKEEEEEEERDHGDVEGDDNHKDDQRMIKRSYDDEGPGSPSFRVYFTNNNNVEDKKINEVMIGNKKDVIKNTTPIAATNRPITLIAATIPSTEVVPVGKKVKKETKRKSFKSALSKNMLNVRSCYSTALSRHKHTHLLPGKAPA
ncbi:hypothetical protein R3W88_009177 [Solanum pinnatisectum]|uniref:Uncharacterized protein n=1 Tax=Solanum pinnatisectum TaxID=50273 RepID=A0AAV9MAI7_9SOLN|nr:hypothetical protein R3W88_009177 [Solanum pinnatisectum]